jgi:aminoglycoside phosphotransferase (APT) family kinase protein
MMSVEDCLPEHLRGPRTTITKISAGLSGAGVYRVEAAERTFVLKISSADEPIEGWRGKVHIQQLAAGAGLAPGVCHVDEARRAVVSVFVVDKSFPMLYMDPRTRETALTQLGQTLRRVHELPLPPDAESKDGLELLGGVWSGLEGSLGVPPFVGDAIERVLAERAPDSDRALVLSHNDVNPSNLVHDGEHLLLLDWDAAGTNDPSYDLATIAVFMRMDDETCQRLLAAHDDEPVAELPARFVFNRRLVAALCGATILSVVRKGGYVGAIEAATLDSTPTLAEFYQRMRSGAVNLATMEGQWWFGLALAKTSMTL